MIPKPLDQIAESDLQTLISNGVREGRTIEYKRDLPGNADADKREFLADVSSFTNTAGGDLIYGVEEDQGTPTRVVGLTLADPDLEIRRLESVIADGLEPRIRYSLRLVPCSGRSVPIIRTDKSWIGPHRVILRGHDKFYGRNASGKYPLDVTELRAAFTLASGVTDKIRAFRTDRIIDLANNVTPLPFVEGAKLILHVLPVDAFAGQPRFDVAQFAGSRVELQPMSAMAWDVRINLEGVIGFATTGGDRPLVRSYIQLYRNGIIEAVNGTLLNAEHGGRRIIPSITYEQRPLQHLPLWFALLRNMGVVPPVVVALTLTGVKGLVMGRDAFWLDEAYPIAQDTLILPETWLEDLSTPAEKILKPMFDLVWNACGYARSANFDGEEKWIARSS